MSLSTPLLELTEYQQERIKARLDNIESTIQEMRIAKSKVLSNDQTSLYDDQLNIGLEQYRELIEALAVLGIAIPEHETVNI